MPKMKEIRSLTGLRGVAACFVVVYHYFNMSTGLGFFKPLLLHGYLSVDLFFVLSGFVISMTYGSLFADRVTAQDYVGFLYRRLGRIYPLYIFVTLALAELSYAGIIHPFYGGLRSAWGLIDNILLIQEWGLADSIGGPSWSISTEFAAYLLFPLVFRRLTNRPWAFGLALCIATGLLIVVAMQSAVAVNQVYDGIPYKIGPLDVVGTGTPYPVLRCLAGFTLGVLSFRLAQSPIISGFAGKRYIGDFAFAVTLVALMFPNADVLIVLLFVPLIICMAMDNSITGRLLSAGVVHWLGVISYSIYLMHVPVSYLLESPLLNLFKSFGLTHAYTITKVAMLAVVIPISAVSFYGIEQPARIWSRRLGGARQSSKTYDPSVP